MTLVVWVLEELGLEYEVKAYARLPSRAAAPELKKVTPYGKVSTYSLLSYQSCLCSDILTLGGRPQRLS